MHVVVHPSRVDHVHVQIVAWRILFIHTVRCALVASWVCPSTVVSERSHTRIACTLVHCSNSEVQILRCSQMLVLPAQELRVQSSNIFVVVQVAMDHVSTPAQRVIDRSGDRGLGQILQVKQSAIQAICVQRYVAAKMTRTIIPSTVSHKVVAVVIWVAKNERRQLHLSSRRVNRVRDISSSLRSKRSVSTIKLE